MAGCVSNLSTDGTGGTVWWDEAAMYQTSEGDDGSEPGPVDYETIEAAGQVVRLSDGEVWENKLIDFTTGGDFTVVTKNATNWTIRNVGFKGRKQSSGSVFAVTDPKGGTSVMQNVYMGDGSGRRIALPLRIPLRPCVASADA